MIKFSGATYEGTWKDDLQHGKGIERWTDSSFFEGKFTIHKTKASTSTEKNTVKESFSGPMDQFTSANSKKTTLTALENTFGPIKDTMKENGKIIKGNITNIILKTRQRKICLEWWQNLRGRLYRRYETGPGHVNLPWWAPIRGFLEPGQIKWRWVLHHEKWARMQRFLERRKKNKMTLIFGINR